MKNKSLIISICVSAAVALLNIVYIVFAAVKFSAYSSGTQLVSGALGVFSIMVIVFDCVLVAVTAAYLMFRKN